MNIHTTRPDKQLNLPCPKCDSSNVKFTASLMFSAPIDLFGAITKAEFMQQRVEIHTVAWNEATILCSDCGHQITGQGDKKNG